MAPINKTWTYCHTRFVNKGAKVVMKVAHTLGTVSIENLP
jgi:hypothetical protein